MKQQKALGFHRLLGTRRRRALGEARAREEQEEEEEEEEEKRWNVCWNIGREASETITPRKDEIGGQQDSD